jgi:hypothetical protein
MSAGPGHPPFHCFSLFFAQYFIIRTWFALSGVEGDVTFRACDDQFNLVRDDIQLIR